MKKFISLIFCMCFTVMAARADFRTYYDAGQRYLAQYQYSSAIDCFKKALRINYLDNSARIGLINSYLARATYAANTEKNWEKSANDFRSALFYMIYYPEAKYGNSAQSINIAENNLVECLKMMNFNTGSSSRYEKAIKLRNAGEFAAAGYEFNQALSNQNIKKDSLVQIADIMNVLGNDGKAVEYYQKAVALDKNDAVLRLKYARALDKINKDDLAVPEYNQALASSSGNTEILYALERIYLKKLAQNPNDAELNANLGAILQKQNRFEEAHRYYSKAETINPTNVNTRLNLGTLQQQVKNYEGAINTYNTILVLYPDNLDANLYKAQCLAALGEHDKAVESYQRVLKIDPTNAIAKLQLLDCLKQTMTPSQMLAYMSSEAAVDGDFIDSIYDYALDLHKKKNYDEAISYYNEVLKRQLNNPEVYVNLALAYAHKKDYTSANKVLQSAKVKFPSNKQIASTMASVNEEVSTLKYKNAADYFDQKDYRRAIEIYSSITPQTASTLLSIAACYQNLDLNDKAIEYYQKAYEKDKNAQTAYYIAALYSDKENWTKAQEYLKKALSQNPNYADAKELLASIEAQNNANELNRAIDLYEAQNYPECLNLLTQVISRDANNAYARYYRGLIYDEQKKLEQAISDYKIALKNTNDLPILNYMIAVDYDSLGQYKNATAFYKNFLNNYNVDDDYKKYAASRLDELKQYE